VTDFCRRFPYGAPRPHPHVPVSVDFRGITLWLPKTAEIYSDFRKHRYYRRHSFDRYMLYSVDSEEKRKEPVSKPKNKPN
jgi:hypothetical protein